MRRNLCLSALSMMSAMPVIAVLMAASSIANAQGLLVPRRRVTGRQSVTDSTGDATGASNEVAERSPVLGETLNPRTGLPPALPVSAIKVVLKINGQVATVTVDHLFHNDGDETLEGTYYFPVPDGASLEEFAVYDGAQRRVGRVKQKEEARAQYAAGVAQGEDPAILEMTKAGWFRSHIYPIPPHADKRVEIIYSEVLGAKDGSVTFDYPLGQGYKKLKVPVENVTFDVDLKSETAIRNVFSPTHPIDINYDGDNHVTGKVYTMGGASAENFRLSYSLSDSDVGLSLITYRRPGEDGYFLLMLSPKVQFDQRRISAKDVIFVIDSSGSMEGAKLNQAKEALRFGLKNTINENDRFNVIAFQSVVTPMEPGLIQANPANIARALSFIDHLSAEGGTDINDALETAMQMFVPGHHPKNLVFLTDGRPESGVTDENQIALNVRAANTARARLFAFGVGSDVNLVLLERLAAENRGAGSNIDDESQLGRTMSTFFSKVSQPVLSNLQVDFGQALVDRVHPVELPDLYTRSQIKIMGRYRNLEDLHNVTVTLTGQMNDQVQQFEYPGLNFPLVTADAASLPKLWATERVGALLAQMRLSGERSDLKQEVIDLADEFNLVTPYTSMYVPTEAEAAREGEPQALNSEARPLNGSASGNAGGIINLALVGGATGRRSAGRSNRTALGGAPLLSTTTTVERTGALSGQVSSKQIDNLTVLSRSTAELLRIQPGVVSHGRGVTAGGSIKPTSFGAGGNYNVNGLRGEEKTELNKARATRQARRLSLVQPTKSVTVAAGASRLTPEVPSAAVSKGTVTAVAADRLPSRGGWRNVPIILALCGIVLVLLGWAGFGRLVRRS
ncbi:MAG TPA: VIT and VWA domain-containing protein [Blastocatellia bacterium]|nr:VIT and VWA domain-containing protein [Blastocatellia bacterium]